MVIEYEIWLRENGKSENTIRTYIINVRQYMKWHMETFGAEMIELRHVNVLDYRSYLQNIKKDAAGTINAKLAALISLNKFLVAVDRQKNAAITKSDLLRVQAAYANPSDLTDKEIDVFRQAVLSGSGVRDHALVTILAYAGLRISEALNLSLDDVDLIGRQITVDKGKGNKERIVFIGDKIIHAVKEYLKERESSGTWLFPGRGSEHLERSAANKLCSRYSDKITPHALRHFYCSHALESGYSFHEVANQAGHSNIHTTLRYTNPTKEAMKDKANKL